MEKRDSYMVNIYKDKFLEKSYSTTPENFKKIHTALIELNKEEGLNFSFGFDGVSNVLEMERDVANKAFKLINKPSEQQTATTDAVNHPTHYTSDPSGVECIEVTKHRDFCIGNAIKYLWRAGLKQDADKTAKEKQIEDLKKAIWYINAEIDLLKQD